MAGLCAARVMADRFESVVVIDRDELPNGSEPRRQVPQGRHPHLLLTAGARLLEGWFPGILDELCASGAVDVDICGDFYWYQAGGCQRRPASQMRGPAMSRPLLERTVRLRVEALSNVVIRDETAAEGLIADASGGHITGIRLTDGTALGCDLVVDASGRAARSLVWLRELGYEPPPTSVVEVDTRYVSRIYRRADKPARDWKAAAIIGDPDTRRLAMLLPMEADRWIVTIAGTNGETAPTDPDGMLAYAQTLESPVIAEVMEVSEPLTEPFTHRFPANQRRHVERMRRFPIGWVLLGDAVCSFNPIYGQGMTAAAQQAEALGRQLNRAGAGGRPPLRRRGGLGSCGTSRNRGRSPPITQASEDSGRAQPGEAPGPMADGRPSEGPPPGRRLRKRSTPSTGGRPEPSPEGPRGRLGRRQPPPTAWTTRCRPGKDPRSGS